jgi:DNA-binding transcriptional LysR family regulator
LPLAAIGRTDGGCGVELRQLRYFVTVADESHVGRAAERLFMAQSSLSQSLQQLEAEFGVPLFHRHPRGVTLTAAGAGLLAPARDVVAAADDLPAIARRAGTAGPSLTVGYVDYARSRVVPALLHHLQRRNGSVVVTLRGGHDSPEVLADLRDGRVDAAVLRSPITASWASTALLVVEPFLAALPRTP